MFVVGDVGLQRVRLNEAKKLEFWIKAILPLHPIS